MVDKYSPVVTSLNEQACQRNGLEKGRAGRKCKEAVETVEAPKGNPSQLESDEG